MLRSIVSNISDENRNDEKRRNCSKNRDLAGRLICENSAAFVQNTSIKILSLSLSMKSDKLFFDSIRYQYDIRVFFSIRYEGSKKGLLFKEFSANFQNFRRIFGIFGFIVVVVVVEDFGSWVFRIFWEFSEFSENFLRKKAKKSLVLRISRYLIWEVRYDTLRCTEKSDISAFDKFSIR